MLASHTSGRFASFGLVVLVVILSSFGVAFSQKNGEIISAAPFGWPRFDELPAWAKSKFTRDQYASLTNNDWTLEEITYLSEGLKIRGFVFRPKKSDKQFPVIIYNRPGTGPRAAITKDNFRILYEMYRCTQRGFVVVASQYRGVGGSDGIDEVGGADLRDVLNLRPLISKLPYADSTKMFMWGTSRGATMTFQAIRDAFPLRAVALVGAPTDWHAQLEHNKDLGKQFWPDYENKREEHIKFRSPIAWPEVLNTPMLFVHGTADPAVDATQIYTLANLLQKHKKVYEIRMFANDNHFVTNHLDEKIDAILNWFSNYPRKLMSIELHALVASGKSSELRTHYYKLKSQSPDKYDFNIDDLWGLGGNLFFEKRMNEAREIFQLVIDEYPTSPRGFEGISHVYESQNDIANAVDVMSRAAEIEPTNAVYRQRVNDLKSKLNAK